MRLTPEGKSRNSKKAAIKRTLNKPFVCLWKPSFIDASSVEIQRVHRLGKKKQNEPRPLLDIFVWCKDCERMLSLGRSLKDSSYKMYQDLPYEIVLMRKRLMVTFKKAKANKIPAALSKAQPDKLFVRG